MKNPDVSIIIVNYNVKELLLKCLGSIYKTKANLLIEVIVVDNSSVDGSVDSVRNQFSDVVVIANTHNAGFPHANNQALRLAKGEYVFLLNPDTELIEDSVSILKKFLETSDNAEIAAPKLLNSDRSLQRSIFRFPRIWFIIAEMFYLESLTGSKYYSEMDLNTIFEVDSASGAALFFRKSLIDRIGFLNEKLFWIEDIDFCFRTKKSGGKVFYVPLTSIIHHSGQSAKKNYNVSISNQIINKIKFYKVHRTAAGLFIVQCISFINVIIRIIIFGVLSPFKEVYSLKMKAYVYTLPGIFSATKNL